MASSVDWYDDRVLARLDHAGDELLRRYGFQTLGRAQQNIVANDQVDTGAMLNSGFVVAPDANTYDEARSMAESANPGSTTPPIPGKPKTVIVAFSVRYALYQEKHKSFLYRAAIDEAQRFGGTVRVVGSEQFG